jgi:hypothetical protein
MTEARTDKDVTPVRLGLLYRSPQFLQVPTAQLEDGIADSFRRGRCCLFAKWKVVPAVFSE